MGDIKGLAPLWRSAQSVGGCIETPTQHPNQETIGDTSDARHTKPCWVRKGSAPHLLGVESVCLRPLGGRLALGASSTEFGKNYPVRFQIIHIAMRTRRLLQQGPRHNANTTLSFLSLDSLQSSLKPHTYRVPVRTSTFAQDCHSCVPVASIVFLSNSPKTCACNTVCIHIHVQIHLNIHMHVYVGT